MINNGLKTLGIYAALLLLIYLFRSFEAGYEMMQPSFILLLFLFLYSPISLIIKLISVLKKEQSQTISFAIHLIACIVLGYCFYQAAIVI